MKRLALLLILALACRPKPAGTGVTGAASPKAAVEQFLNSVRAQDLQAMSAIWGNDKGPARDQFPREEVEKRELIMQCYFAHDSFRIVREMDHRPANRTFEVEMKKGNLTRTTMFSTSKGPGSRWYVDNGEMDPVKDFCRPAQTPNR